MARTRKPPEPDPEPVEQIDSGPSYGLSWPHPQAKIAGGVSGIGVFVSWVLARLHIVDSPEVATAISGAIVTGVFWFGHEGLVGAWQWIKYGANWNRIKYGEQAAPPPPPPATPRKRAPRQQPPKQE